MSVNIMLFAVRCGTDLSKAERNPFLYAKEQLQAFSEIEEIQNIINNTAQNVRKRVQQLMNFISDNREFIKLLKITTENISLIEVEDIRMLGANVKKWFEFCDEVP